MTKAAGDRLTWISEAGVVIDEIIPSDNWRHKFTIKAPKKFLRAEVVADKSQDRLIAELIDWGKGKTNFQRSQQSLTNPPPIRRALSNPVYFSA